VQGFDGEATLGGRTGGYWRNNLTLPLHRSFAPYVGVDVGHVSGEAAQGLSGGTLSGGYVGLRGDFAGALSWDAFAGWPLQSPSGFDASGRVVGFRLAYSF
jgi:hemolysin activation/secretion protein